MPQPFEADEMVGEAILGRPSNGPERRKIVGRGVKSPMESKAGF